MVDVIILRIFDPNPPRLMHHSMHLVIPREVSHDVQSYTKYCAGDWLDVGGKKDGWELVDELLDFVTHLHVVDHQA